MTELVTLEQAKAHLRVTHSLDDSQIELMVRAASKRIVRYLGEAAEEFVDSSGDALSDSSGLLVPEDVQQATLLLVGDFYANREPTATDVVDSQFGYGYMPRAVVALLWPIKVPMVR